MITVRIFTYLLSVIALFGVGIFVLLNNPKSKPNRWFFAFICTVVIWILSLNFADNFNNVDLAMMASRAAFAVSGFIFYSLYQFSRNFPRELKGRNWFGYISLGLACLILVLSPTQLTVQSVQIVDYGAEVVGGAFYPILLIVILANLFFTGRNLWHSRKGVTAIEKQQVRLISYGLASFAFVALTTNLFLVLFGVSSLGFLGPPSVLLFVVPTSNAIVKHRLFDIRSVVARSVAYVFSIGVFTGVYAFVAFGLAQGIVLRNILVTQRSQEIFNVFLAVVLAFTFPTIRRYFEKITDRVFYRDRYDPQLLVSEIGRVLASEIRLEPLTKRVLQILTSHMRAVEANIVVVDKDDIYYQTHGDKIHQLYHRDDLKLLKNQMVVADELPAADTRRMMLERHNVRAVLSMKTKESFVGYLLIDEKRSGDIFTSEDIQTLRIIADELAVAIQNARSYQEIQTFNATLREKIRQATKDLRHANNELKALDKAKDEFISMASHQLRTPLTAVRGYTSMVMDGDFGKIGKEQQETLQQAFDAATRMGRLVDDLLNVSRIQSGKFRIERTPVDLNKVLPEEVSLIETTASSKSVAVHFNPSTQPVPILSLDEGKTRQALMNLMDNAIYYSSTAAGGGKVEVFLESDAKYVSFRVVDNGIGVPKAQQAKLFKKFYRAPNAQKTRPDGTGLGLFLVGKVVQGQGGEIIFESIEGKGSTFGFKLPIKPAGDGLEGAGEASVEEATEQENKKSPTGAGRAES